MTDMSEAGQRLTKVQTRRASLSVTASVRPLLWGLANQMSVFCEHVFGRLGKFGVGPDDLRVDNGDGTVGGYNLTFGPSTTRSAAQCVYPGQSSIATRWRRWM